MHEFAASAAFPAPTHPSIRGGGLRPPPQRGRRPSAAAPFVDSIIWAGEAANIAKASANYVRGGLVGRRGGLLTRFSGRRLLRASDEAKPVSRHFWKNVKIGTNRVENRRKWMKNVVKNIKPGSRGSKMDPKCSKTRLKNSKVGF